MGGTPQRPLGLYLLYTPEPEPCEPAHRHLTKNRLDTWTTLFVSLPASPGQKLAFHKISFSGILGNPATWWPLLPQQLALLPVLLRGNKKLCVLIFQPGVLLAKVARIGSKAKRVFVRPALHNKPAWVPTDAHRFPPG